MKKFLSIVSIALLIVAMTLSMVACNKTETVTLTLYDNDGTTVLSTQKVEKGKAPTMPEAPTKKALLSGVGLLLRPVQRRSILTLR